MIKFRIKNVDRVIAFLRSVPLGVKTEAQRAVGEYLIGDESHGLRHDPGYVYVNRQAGFPNSSYISAAGNVVPGYSSARQHRYVMAGIAAGTIVPGQRRNSPTDLSRAWRITGDNVRLYIGNDKPYLPFVQGDSQTRMHRLIGWRHWRDVIETNISGALRAGVAAVNEWLRSRGR